MQTRMFAAALAAVALGAGSATSASAATTLVVDQSSGPYTSIGAALADAQEGDTIAIHAGRYAETLTIDADDVVLSGDPGTTIASDAPFVVTMNGLGDELKGLTVEGGAGGVLAAGQGESFLNSTLQARDQALAVRDYGAAWLAYTMVHATDPAGRAVTAVTTGVPAPFGTFVYAVSSVFAGGPQGAGFDLASGTDGDAIPVGGANIRLGHVTVAGAATAIRRTTAGQGGALQVEAYNSIFHGAGADTVTGTGNELTAADAATFANPAALDFHLRADSAAVASGGAAVPHNGPNPLRDFAGTAFPTDGRASAGAFQFVGHDPVARITSSGYAAAGGPATFDASGSSDPDPGGAIATYTWTFDDGTPAVTTRTATVQHVFQGIGTHTAWVRVRDITGGEASSAPTTIVVNDRTAPTVRIGAPGRNARLRRHKVKDHRTLINVLKFSGTVADTGVGSRDVRVTLFRTSPKPAGKASKGKCLWLDGARRRTVVRSCRNPAFAPAAVRGGAWSWHTPANLALPAGSWTLTVRAIDAAHNVSPPSVLHFTVT
jgi:hypothetical protein